MSRAKSRRALSITIPSASRAAGAIRLLQDGLNFLAPGIVEAIVTGSRPVALDGKALLNVSNLPVNWAEQKKLLHIA